MKRGLIAFYKPQLQYALCSPSYTATLSKAQIQSAPPTSPQHAYTPTYYSYIRLQRMARGLCTRKGTAHISIHNKRKASKEHRQNHPTSHCTHRTSHQMFRVSHHTCLHFRDEKQNDRDTHVHASVQNQKER